MNNYRQKVYEHYSSKRNKRLAPVNIEGFKAREPYFNMLIKKFFGDDKNIKILEIGCGHGAFVYYIKKAGYANVLGIDGSKEQVNEAKRLGVENVIYGDLVEYLKTCKKSSIDLLIAFDVIEHFTKQELTNLVDEFFRCLKQGGIIITHQPNSEGPFGSVIRYGDLTHELGFTKESISQLFLSAGFTVVKSIEDKPIIHGIKSFCRYILWEYAVRLIYKSLIIIEAGGVDKDAIFTRNFLSVIKK